jgi:hypothetical protein
MPRLDRYLLVFVAVGVWGLLAYYVTLPERAESQDFYYEVMEAVNKCNIYGRVREDFYGAHRLQARIDCGPSWIGDDN